MYIYLSDHQPMMTSREKRASDMFNCTDRERALFEAGIKMGTIYHQFVGTPFDSSCVEALEKTIEQAISVQPYVESVSVKINRNILGFKKDRYGYASLAGEMIDATITIHIGPVIVKAEMRYDNDLAYPLMYVSDVKAGVSI